MRMLTTWVLGLTASVALAGTPADPNLRGQMTRRLELVAPLQAARFDVAVLSELCRAVPAAAVLSRVAFDATRGELTFALSAGTRADAEAIAAALAKVHACTAPAVTQGADGLIGTCALKPRPHPIALGPAAGPRQGTDSREAEVLRGRIAAAQSAVPDAPGLDDLKANLADIAETGGAWAVTSSVGAPTTQGPVDVFPITFAGAAGFDGALGVLQNFANLRRVVWIDAFELREPKLKNGEWAVTFSVRARTFRYRVEEELTSQSLTLNAFDRTEAVFAEVTRNPFGPAAPVFAGSSKAPAATACRVEGAATPLGKVELDALAVVYLSEGKAPRCAMVVDDQGGCHVVSVNDRIEAMPGAKVASIDADAITVANFRALPDGHLQKKTVALKVATKVKPPAWFCRAK